MSTLVEIKHNTVYHYSEPVYLAPQLIRLRPAPYSRTEIQSYKLNIAPSQHFIHWQQDAFNNHIARVVFSEPIETLTLAVTLVANLATINPFDFFVEDTASQWPFSYPAELKLDLAPYLITEQAGPSMQAFLLSLANISGNVVDFLLRVSKCLVDRIGYTERLTPGVQTCEESLQIGSGSCRDSAWLLVQTFRHLGLAARFVSGYSVQLADNSHSGVTNTQKDSTDLHAWIDVFIPGGGWIGIDSTSGLLTGSGHIPLCSTREPASAAPITGKMGPASAKLFFENTITRLA